MSSLLAHGIGGRSDLPLPLSFFIYGASIALVLSFAAVGTLWVTPRLRAAAAGRDVADATSAVARAVRVIAALLGLLAATMAVTAAFWGSSNPGANPTPWLVFIALWIAGQFASALIGDVWRLLNPLATLAAAAAFAGRRAGWIRPAPDVSYWPAVAVLFGFHWLELAYHDSSAPATLGRAIVVTAVFVVVPCLWWGRQWQERADGFQVWFGLLARLAPLAVRDGRLRLRWPGAGLGDVELDNARLTAILVVLGGTTFDGLERSRFWLDNIGVRDGWSGTAVNTVGMVWMMAAVAALYLGASRAAARSVRDRSMTDLALAYGASLIPIAFGYSVGHYFSALVFDGQSTIVRISDPFARGWDLFGTATWRTNFALIGTTAIAWVQAIGIVAGHIGAVVVAHDRALEGSPDRDAAIRSQYAMLVAMIVFTIVGLTLLLSA